ncbi:hypothetical protein DSO57_1037669 [Entomophthora muscae]|uniref:Uncharacterized protein n=1 Tax=Entomophthora muscae TaxID=34485 RepID=A0ACC2UIS7_9FUNG|nr:hypothetical protein DSO57_1037669 [Entomophthora muscae]
MGLKSTLVINQEPSPEEGTRLQPNPMTTTLKQDNQVANLISLTNERTGAAPPPRDTLAPSLLPFLNKSTRSPGPPAPLPADSCPPGVPFGPIYFTEYPLRPKYNGLHPRKDPWTRSLGPHKISS